MKPYISAKPLLAIPALSVLMMALAQGQGTATTKTAVQEAQQRLRVLGYEPGPADGAMGSRTISALKKFEADHGLRVTETLDQKTLEALRATGPKAVPAPASRRTLTKDAERSVSVNEEKRDWESADAKATVEAYIAFRTKYPDTQRVRILSGKVTSGMSLDHNKIVGGVFVNGEQVANDLTSDELVKLGLADYSQQAAPGGRTSTSISVKTLPNATLVMKNVEGVWKIATVAPAE